MKSFDQSLKYLLQHDPEGFIAFGLGEPSVRILEPVPSVLPSRGRDIDGAYLEASPLWTEGERADHLAVLWFVAEAEGVPGQRLRNAALKEKLMESQLYLSIIEDGNAEGMAKSILTVLDARDIPVSETIRARILGCTDLATLEQWTRRAALVSTAAAVVRAKVPARSTAGAARHVSKT